MAALADISTSTISKFYFVKKAYFKRENYLNYFIIPYLGSLSWANIFLRYFISQITQFTYLIKQKYCFLSRHTVNFFLFYQVFLIFWKTIIVTSLFCRINCYALL